MEFPFSYPGHPEGKRPQAYFQGLYMLNFRSARPPAIKILKPEKAVALLETSSE